MTETRSEFEAKWKEKYAKWNTVVEGKSLHDLVKLWQQGDEQAGQVISAFVDINNENYRTFRDVANMVNEGSSFPGNHRDFKKLPEGIACTMCPAFYGVAGIFTDTMTVRCEWPNGVQSVQMKVDATKDGGAVELKGNCRNSFGISKY
jgi:hypothetical protein